MSMRKLTKKNWKKIYLLGSREFQNQFWYKKEFIKEILSRGGFHLGIFKRGKLIAAILVEFPDPPKAWIYFFVVDKKFQRMGIGTKILNALYKKLPREYFLLFVDVGENDRIAKKFYEKNGFQKEGFFRQWFGKKENGLIYVKRLLQKRNN